MFASQPITGVALLWPPGLPMVPKAMRRMLAENHLRRLQMSPTVGVCFNASWPMFFKGRGRSWLKGWVIFWVTPNRTIQVMLFFCKTVMVEMVKRGSPSDRSWCCVKIFYRVPKC